MTRESLKQNYSVANQRVAATWNFRDIDLSVARADQEIALAGDFLQIPTAAFSGETTVDTASSVGEAFVKFDEKDAKPYYINAGSTIRQKNNPFGTLYLTNAAQAGAKMRIYTSALADSDPQAVTNFSTDIADAYTAEVSDNDITTTAAAVIVPARAGRKAGLIQNNDPSLTLIITVSGGTTGVRVPPNGGTYSYAHSAAVYGVTASGTITAANIISNEEYS